MRYETVTESFIQLPEKSAIVKNMDSRTAVVLKIVDSQTRQVSIFPNQSAKYANCDAYVKTDSAGRKVRIQITPLKVVGWVGAAAELQRRNYSSGRRSNN